MSKIYKFFGPDAFEWLFKNEGYCGVKCSLPKDYNDPYELFLAMDFNLPSEYLAFYNEVIQEIPQYPTTCFSSSVISAPMWAHYAKNQTGFAIEFDLDEIQTHFEGNPLWEVSYRKAPHENLKAILEKAFTIKKPRYTYDLKKFAFSESYFSKYEECRARA